MNSPGNLVRVRGCPGVFIHPAFAHANEGRFPGQPLLLREVGVPGVPLLARILPARIRRNERNVKTPPQQFHLGLGLVVPITGLPRPRIAGRRLVWHDHDAPLLSGGRIPDREAFICRPGEGGDFQSISVHEKIVADEPVMPGAFAAVEGWFGPVHGSDETTHREGDRRHGEKFCRPGYLRTRFFHDFTHKVSFTSPESYTSPNLQMWKIETLTGLRRAVLAGWKVASINAQLLMFVVLRPSGVNRFSAHSTARTEANSIFVSTPETQRVCPSPFLTWMNAMAAASSPESSECSLYCAI